jgi:hypothetical protein
VQKLHKKCVIAGVRSLAQELERRCPRQATASEVTVAGDILYNVKKSFTDHSFLRALAFRALPAAENSALGLLCSGATTNSAAFSPQTTLGAACIMES